MKIDHQQGPRGHLRLGRLLVSRQPDRLHRPWRPTAVTTVQNRMDAEKAARVCQRAEEVLADAEHAPIAGEHDLVDRRQLERLGEALTDWHLSHETERFGSVAVHVGGTLWSVGWLDANRVMVEMRIRHRLRMLRYRLRGVDLTPQGTDYRVRGADFTSPEVAR